jgi:DNA replication protein DnaC
MRDFRSNPFATRYVRPGAMPFLFRAGLDTAALVERFSAQGWRGAIIGPHGSGKSTLLDALCRELERAGQHVFRITLHNGQRRVRWPVAAPPIDENTHRSCEEPEHPAPQVLAIDGYEQIDAWNRWRLASRRHRYHCGLLVTSHRATRLPELYRTQIDCKLFERIVARLLGNDDRLMTSDDIRRAFDRHGQNAREALFALYDLYEARARGGLARL